MPGLNMRTIQMTVADVDGNRQVLFYTEGYQTVVIPILCGIRVPVNVAAALGEVQRGVLRTASMAAIKGFTNALGESLLQTEAYKEKLIAGPDSTSDGQSEPDRDGGRGGRQGFPSGAVTTPACAAEGFAV